VAVAVAVVVLVVVFVVGVDVSLWICLSVAATSAFEVPPAVTVVNTRVLREVVDWMLDDASGMLSMGVGMEMTTCDLGGSYRMFEGEEGDAYAVHATGVHAYVSRCSSSSTPIAADKGKRVDGDNIVVDVEVEKGEAEGRVAGSGGRDDSVWSAGMSLRAAEMSAMVCCTPRMKAS